MDDSPTAALVWTTFSAEIQECRDLHKIVGESSTIPSAGLHLVFESILLRAFRAVESALGSAFIAYLLDAETLSGTKVVSCLNARSRAHVDEVLLGAGTKWVDWSDASTVRTRASIFFEDDNPISLSLANSSQPLNWMKILRNHVAHNSVESMNKYKRSLETMLTSAPLSPPTVGEFLASRPTKGPLRGREVLSYFIDCCEDVIRNALEAPPAATNTSGA